MDGDKQEMWGTETSEQIADQSSTASDWSITIHTRFPSQPLVCSKGITNKWDKTTSHSRISNMSATGWFC